MRKARPSVKNMLTCILAGIMFSLFLPLLQFAGQTMEAAPVEKPVYEITATWGDFDEIRLFRYYRLEDIPDAKDVPKQDTEYHDREYTYISTDGPVKTEFGECWEAMYGEEE